MDYEMMVKCAYEEIMDGIEKEAFDYSTDQLNWPTTVRNAIVRTGASRERFDKTRNAVVDALGKIPWERKALRQSRENWYNAKANLKMRAVNGKSHPPLASTLAKMDGKISDISGQMDRLDKRQASLRGFLNAIESQVGKHAE